MTKNNKYTSITRTTNCEYLNIMSRMTISPVYRASLLCHRTALNTPHLSRTFHYVPSDETVRLRQPRPHRRVFLAPQLYSTARSFRGWGKCVFFFVAPVTPPEIPVERLSYPRSRGYPMYALAINWMAASRSHRIRLQNQTLQMARRCHCRG